MSQVKRENKSHFKEKLSKYSQVLPNVVLDDPADVEKRTEFTVRDYYVYHCILRLLHVSEK